MTVARLFTYWLGTVLIGSVLGPLVLFIISASIGSVGNGTGFFPIIFICIIASMICSLPAMLVFYLVLTFQIDHKIPAAKKQRTLMWTHLICGFMTFFILGALIGFEILPTLAVFFVIYTGIGMLFWNNEFKKQVDKAVTLNMESSTTEETKDSF